VAPSVLIPRPVTNLRHQERRRVFCEGPKFFELCPVFSNYIQHIFPGGAKNFLEAEAPSRRACLSLAVVRGNADSIPACVQVWSDFRHPQCIPKSECLRFLQALLSSARFALSVNPCAVLFHNEWNIIFSITKYPTLFTMYPTLIGLIVAKLISIVIWFYSLILSTSFGDAICLARHIHSSMVPTPYGPWVIVLLLCFWNFLAFSCLMFHIEITYHNLW